MTAEHEQIILDQYDTKFDLYTECVEKVKIVVAEVLKKADVRDYSVTFTGQGTRELTQETG